MIGKESQEEGAKKSCVRDKKRKARNVTRGQIESVTLGWARKLLSEKG